MTVLVSAGHLINRTAPDQLGLRTQVSCRWINPKSEPILPKQKTLELLKVQWSYHRHVPYSVDRYGRPRDSGEVTFEKPNLRKSGNGNYLH